MILKPPPKSGAAVRVRPSAAAGDRPVEDGGAHGAGVPSVRGLERAVDGLPGRDGAVERAE
jgi:hypothetical protein